MGDQLTKLFLSLACLLAIATAFTTYTTQHLFRAQHRLPLRWAVQPQGRSRWLDWSTQPSLRPVGAQSDILTALEGVSNLEPEPVEVNSIALLKALQQQQVDVGLDTCEPVPAGFLTSAPLFRREYWVLARQADSRFARVTAATPWRSASNSPVVGFMTNAKISAALTGLPQWQARAYPDVVPVHSLTAGRIDLVIADHVRVIDLLGTAAHPTPLAAQLRVVGEAIATEDQCFLIYGGHVNASTLLSELNHGIAQIKINGTLSNILQTWEIWTPSQTALHTIE